MDKETGARRHWFDRIRGSTAKAFLLPCGHFSLRDAHRGNGTIGKPLHEAERAPALTKVKLDEAHQCMIAINERMSMPRCLEGHDSAQLS